MIQQAGNQAYRALAGVLELPGTDHLGKIDTSLAAPVHELGAVVQAGLVENWWLVREVSVDGASTETWNLRPRTAGDWTVMTRNGIVVTQPIPPEYDTFILGAGVQSDGTAALTSALFYEGGAGSTIATIFQPLLFLSGTLAYNNLLAKDAEISRRFPWYYAPEGKTKNSIGIRTLSSVAGVVALTFRCLAAPPGVLPLSIW